MTVFVNGRYAVHQITGMQRYAREIVARLPPQCSVVQPHRRVRGVQGHLWEQVSLPRRVKGSLLWSPCSTGPVSVEQQVVTIHDCAFVDQAACFTRAFAAWYQWLVPRLARRARAIITVSKFSRDRIAEHCRVAPEKITVVYNGIDRAFRPQEASCVEACAGRLALPRPYVLCVGSLEPRKNLRRLLEAWNLLATRHSDVSLVLVGAEGKVFRDAGLTHTPPRVHLAGYLGDDDLPALYAGAEVFLYPSVYEGFGLPVAEAMACGTPVVCSDVTALPEVAGQAAELVDPLDVESIAGGVQRLLRDAQRRDQLRAAGLAQSRQFSWERAAAETWHVLDSSR
jgi:glycosyltransferase involved in cell wall biosynthesis